MKRGSGRTTPFTVLNVASGNAFGLAGLSVEVAVAEPEIPTVGVAEPPTRVAAGWLHPATKHDGEDGWERA